MNEHAFAPPPPGHFITVVNMVYGGVFQHTGQPMPLSELRKIPPNLRQEHYIIRHDPKAPESDAPASLNYVIGSQYAVDGNGLRRPKHIEREIIRLELADLEQRRIEKALSQSNEQQEAALEIIQQDHETLVARDKAMAEYKAKEVALADEFAQEAQQKADAEVSQLSGNSHQISPTIGEAPNVAPEQHLPMPEAKPRKM
jgi:hypothetical protein